ncbi:MAG: isochorismatase family protein [Verrucomicrobia bacterium]|nr:isochorismatase family protein [Verrucomicrobiota bacterium]
MAALGAAIYAWTFSSTVTADDRDPNLALEARSRVRTGEGGDKYEVKIRTLRWDAGKTAIIVCDMWDDHTCKGAAARVAEMATAMNQTLRTAREKGVFIIHAPSGRTSFYHDTPQRRRALEAPRASVSVEFKWNYWNPDREGAPLAEIFDGGCGCQQPCPGFLEDEHRIRQWKKGGPVPWTRQIATIEIAAQDAISDNGQEIYNLLQERQIDNVILMGVHTNICVSGRPFGLRQMVYLGKNVVLCRDLTDALFQPKTPALDQFRGTDLIVEHIERRLCPTITSTSFTGQKPFRFKADARSADL